MTIKEVINEYERALNTSSTEEVMKLYGENPVFMPQNSVALEGREAVRAGYDHVFKTIRLNVKFTLYEVEEFGILAFVRTSSEGETTILANNSKVKEANNELFIFRNENGDWKIHRYLFATSNPPNLA
ncbi:MAG: nuclear transport factor 2 family protein [Pyrinomonadaceae bacterium]